MAEPYPIIQINPEWVLEGEALGSKEKFWFILPITENPNEKRNWLFKFPQPNTGQHWAEKVAAEIADHLGILHGKVELAVFDGENGSATESFAREGRELYHGNQLMAGRHVGYDVARRFRQSEHTFENIWLTLEKVSAGADAQQRAKETMASYLVLDALIGNTDRHHENWGILVRRVGDRTQEMMAPSFDHASSLGRELRDTAREKHLKDGSVGSYVERGRGGIFWTAGDKHGPSPLRLVQMASHKDAESFRGPLAILESIDSHVFTSIIERIPVDWMTDVARRFALTILCYNLEELRKIKNQ